METLPQLDRGSEAHASDLYRNDRVASGVSGFDAVGEREIAAFQRDGYLVVNHAFSNDEVSSALQGLLDLIDGKAPGFKGVQFERAAKDRLATLTPEQKQDYVRKLMGFVSYDQRLQALAAHPRLLDLVGRLLGDVPTMFQDMALLKPPHLGREKPWHQDHAYFDLPLGTPVVGVWLALDPATPENGCMHVLPGSHLEGPVVHFNRRDWQICDTDVQTERDVVVPLAPGGVLLFHGLLHHGTPVNRSPMRRRAVQFHYKPAGAGRIDKTERMAIFGSEGKDVSC